ESAARLSHPNIVNTYDVGREGETYYIVMELVDGPSLAEIIAADGKLPEPVAIDYAAQICSGLAYAHRQGLLHRDVKPANILVTKDDVCKLSDFGIARAVSQQTMAMTKPGLVMGSVFYLSPEQAQGHDLHETSDLYSLGIVLYQMLTGKLPFAGESPVTVALKHISDPVPTIDTAKIGVSPALASIVNRLLQKNPAHRFQSASDVASTLREARERPGFAPYGTANDAPAQSFGTVSAPQPPPRPSRFPDTLPPFTSISEDDERKTRSGSWMILGLLALLAIATAVGYFTFGNRLSNPLAQSISVGDYVNMSDSQAYKSVVNAGLVPRLLHSSSDTVPANKVIRQTPSAGTKSAKDSVVELVVSNGLPTLGLRDVRGFASADDAKRLLTEDKFAVRLQPRFDAAPKGSVIDQKPAPGSQVRQGSTVLLIVSQGLAPVKMPNLVSQSLTDANKLAAQFGFTINVTEKAPFDTYAPNAIAQQDVKPGTLVDHGSTVNVVVSSGGGLVAVPDVGARDYKSAMALLAQAGLKPIFIYSIQSDANGSIIQQTPDPGTQIQRGSSVTLNLSVPGEVPDTQNMSLQDAEDTLAAAGYSVGNVAYTSEGNPGKVVRTEPEAGTKLGPTGSVTIYVNGTGSTP
ncbi:MAG: PASTA domain-containing protein, partial [Candidatus Baltobacteraceae bacterium]